MKYLVRIQHVHGVMGHSDEHVWFNDLIKAKKYMLDEVLKILEKAKSNNNEIKPLQPYYWEYALAEKHNGLLTKHYIWLEVF